MSDSGFLWSVDFGTIEIAIDREISFEWIKRLGFDEEKSAN